MGAGQIGGIATLLDIDFKNPAGFIGEKVEPTEGQHVLHYFSHSMMFCLGTLIEAHVVLTAASCVIGERYQFEVVGGTHRFLENIGVTRTVNQLCVHRGLNYSSNKYEDCSPDNLALLILSEQFPFHTKDPHGDFLIRRLRYGAPPMKSSEIYHDTSCRYYGFGSRRNGFLIPMLINLRRVKVTLLPQEKCLQMFNVKDKFLCIQQHQCKSEKFGTLCPDDVGSVLECSGFARGMMVSRLVDRPCGVGFIDLNKYTKFLTCGVDDSRDVLDIDTGNAMEFTSHAPEPTPELLTILPNEEKKLLKKLRSNDTERRSTSTSKKPTKHTTKK